MQRGFFRSRRLTACAAAAMLTASSLAGGTLSLPVSAADEPEYFYTLLAGGSQIGMEIIVKASGDIHGVSIDAHEPASNQLHMTDDGFRLTLPINAAELRKPHHLDFMLGDEGKSVQGITAVDYLTKIMNDDKYEEYLPVVTAMLNYGYAAEDYFSGADYADYYMSEAPDFSGVTINGSKFTGKEAYNADLEEKNLPYRYYGMNLTLLDKIKFSLYFDTSWSAGAAYLTDGEFGNQLTKTEEAGEGFTKVVRTIPAYRLTDTFTCVHATADPVDFSPVQYLAAAAAGSNAKLTAVCKALYAYGEAAKAAQPGDPDTEVHSGRLTHYDYRSGCASLDEMVNLHQCPVAALTDDEYNKYAGGWIEITCGDKKLNALVADAMPFSDNPSRRAGDVDIDTQSFLDFIGEDTGDLPITWRLIPMPDAEDYDVRVKFQKNSKVYWCAVTLMDARYPIKAVKYNGRELEQNMDGGLNHNFFFGSLEQPESDGIYTFTFIDMFDHELTVDAEIDLPTGDSGLSYSRLVRCTGQFPK